MKDFFNNDIKVGDYIIYPMIEGTCAIVLYVLKVVRFTPKTIVIARVNSWRGSIDISNIQCPERAVIISEELALQKEPRLKDYIGD